MVKAHPICKMRKVVEEGKTPEQAERECIAEGKIHGISKLSEEYRRISGTRRR